MVEAPRGRRRIVVLLATTALGGAVLAGCAAGPGGGAPGVSPAAATVSAPAGSSSPATSSSSPGGSSTASVDLTKGLLPASAFGNAQVHTWSGSGDQHGGPGWWGGGWWGGGWWGGRGDGWPGVDVQPASCATALDQLSTSLGGTTGQTDRAARVAVADTAVTVESLVQGTVPSIDQLRSAVTACSTVTIGGPGSWQVKVTLTPVDVPALGKGSLAVRTEFTATGAKNGGTHQWSALHAVAQDGNRLVVLMSTRKDGTAPDEKAFRDLFQQAYQVQAKALD